MGYYSKLDIYLKENGLEIVRGVPAEKPIAFLYQTSRMKEPRLERTRIGDNGMCLLVGNFVTWAWLSECVDWQQVPGWDYRVKLVKIS